MAQLNFQASGKEAIAEWWQGGKSAAEAMRLGSLSLHDISWVEGDGHMRHWELRKIPRRPAKCQR